jgi:membrane protein YqaA with SNARE-associated domain
VLNNEVDELSKVPFGADTLLPLQSEALLVAMIGAK